MNHFLRSGRRKSAVQAGEAVLELCTAGIDTIMSADRDFDRFAGITRLDPLAWYERAVASS